MSEETGRRVPAGRLERFCCQAMEKAGVPRDHAAIVADSLVQANLRGVDSHGVTRLDIYIQRLKLGLVDPRAEGQIVAETGATVLLDGQNGLGQVIGMRAAREAIRKARESSVGLVGVRNSNHYGAAAYYSMAVAAAGMIGLSATNAPANMAPWGGKARFLGTNPFSVAVPADEAKPFVLDMASSVVARGRIILAAKKGEKIPLGWAIDPSGRDTEDAQEALAGTVLPVGGPKGYGLAMVVEILCGILTGASFGPQIGSLYGDFSRGQDTGHFVGAIAIDAFMPPAQFKQRMDQLIREIKESPRAHGVEQIYIPGEPEFAKEEERRREGIPLSETVLGQLRQVSEELSVPLDF